MAVSDLTALYIQGWQYGYQGFARTECCTHPKLNVFKECWQIDRVREGSLKKNGSFRTLSKKGGGHKPKSKSVGVFVYSHDLTSKLGWKLFENYLTTFWELSAWVFPFLKKGGVTKIKISFGPIFFYGLFHLTYLSLPKGCVPINAIFILQWD